MKIIESDIVVIGAGLTGLTLAYLLREHDISITLVEARDRVGGRIHTKYSDAVAPTELGATWLGSKHTALFKLLDELQIGIFEQQLGETAIYEPLSTSPPQIVRLPPNDEPSYRIQGGSSVLINELIKSLDEENIYLNQAVHNITENGKLITSTQDHKFISDLVVSTLPPYLFNQKVTVDPILPESLSQIAENTHTWMGDSIKVGLMYETPFWREGDSSGTIFSNVGPIPEMYDHSNIEDNLYGLKGFFNGNYHSITKDERLVMILNQLKKYYGEVVDSYVQYEETVWRNQPYTFAPYQQHILPHQNNGHQVYQESYLDGKLFIGGSETAIAYPGYMDGAVRSAQYLAERIRSSFN